MFFTLYDWYGILIPSLSNLFFTSSWISALKSLKFSFKVQTLTINSEAAAVSLANLTKISRYFRTNGCFSTTSKSVFLTLSILHFLSAKNKKSALLWGLAVTVVTIDEDNFPFGTIIFYCLRYLGQYIKNLSFGLLLLFLLRL